MPDINELITNNLNIWSSSVKKKTAVGRGSSKKIELYGIKKLRELILELAVRGLLVPQNPNDEPALELLKHIEVEKSKLFKERNFRKQKPLGLITEEDELFERPSGWEFERLGNLSYVFSGSSFKSESFNESGGTRVIKITNVGVGELIETNDYLPESFSTECANFRVSKGDLVLALTRPFITTGLKVSICSNSYHHALLNQRVAAIKAFMDNRFLYQFMQSVYVLGLYKERFGNSGLQPNLKMGDVTDLIIPVPPLLEQHRIVAKVDELMALCDQLEQQQEDSISAHQTLVKTLLDALVDSANHSQTTEGKTKFEQAWERIAEHFDTLFTTEDSIDQLKQTILQLAVMGKLVPQDLNDEPASELIKRITAIKTRLIEDKIIKKQKLLPTIDSSEENFELPASWQWERLQNITSKITDGDHKTPTRIESGMRMLSAKNVRDGYIEYSNCDFISECDYLKSRERCLPEKGDLLIVSVGGTIGRNSLISEDSMFSLVRSVALIKPILFCSDYLKYAADSPLLQNSIHNNKRGGAQPCLYLSEISKFPFPLPPLMEQKRIVDKVKTLFEVCDQLKSNITLSQLTQLKLSDSISQQALSH